MYCSSCGHESAPGSKFCAGCGAQLQATPRPSPAPEISERKGSGMSVTSLVLGILAVFPFSILAGVPAVITGHVAVGQKRQGKGMAIAGLVMGWFSIAIVVPLLLVTSSAMFLKRPTDVQLSGPSVTPRMIEKQLARLDKFEAKVTMAKGEFPGVPAKKWQQINTSVAKCRQTLNEMQSLTEQKEIKAKLAESQKELIDARKLLKEITGQATSDDDAGK